MPLKKRLFNLLLFLIAAITALKIGKISWKLHYFLEELFRIEVNSYVLQFVIIFLISVLCLLLVRKLALSKRIIFLIVLVFVVFSVLYSRHQFYVYHDHPDFGDMKNVPECMKESNFDSYWEYLNRGCHLTLWEFSRSQVYKSGCWLLGFFGVDFLIRRLKRKEGNVELIDENEE
ncbi:hypothetical protein D3C71_551730 [compost metagenome]